jgi:hypothetical protein
MMFIILTEKLMICLRKNGNFSCIIDLSGNDYYTSNSNYSLAGAVFSSGFIFDKEGDDTYKGKNVTLGSAICGLGVLYDESGNDTYQANQFSIGAASFGIGLLLTEAVMMFTLQIHIHRDSE